MSRSSVMVLVSNSAMFTLCRATQILWEEHAHSPFLMNIKKMVGNVTTAYPGKYWYRYEYPNNMWQLLTSENTEVPHSQCNVFHEMVRHCTIGYIRHTQQHSVERVRANAIRLLRLSYSANSWNVGNAVCILELA